jgi:hypothetical protein
MDEADLDALAEMRAQSFVTRTRPAPFLAISNFLPTDVHQRVLNDLIASEKDFWSNHAEGRDSLVVVNPRASQPVMNELQHRFDELVMKLAALGAPVDDITRCHLEPPSATAAGHANFHAPHIDNDPLSGVDIVLPRRISFVWHAFRQPQRFTGGELRLWNYSEVASDRGPWTPAATWTDHPCMDNSLIAFSSSSLHEVLPVQLFDGEFADRRFAIVTAAHAS